MDNAVLTPDELRVKLAPLLRGRPVRQVILFGSRARGEADAFSDTDLLIVAETQRPFPERCKDFMDLLRAIPTAVEMLIYTPEEFRRMREEARSFLATVLEEGIIVYETAA
jgi:predicted nucleotidyltransferase